MFLKTSILQVFLELFALWRCPGLIIADVAFDVVPEVHILASRPSISVSKGQTLFGQYIIMFSLEITCGTVRFCFVGVLLGNINTQELHLFSDVPDRLRQPIANNRII